MITRLVQHRFPRISSIYGTRKIRLIKDGYDTLTVQQPFPVPWYEVFPLDFVTENLWPWEIRDERVVDLAMVPAGTVPAEAVVSRAEFSKTFCWERAAGPGSSRCCASSVTLARHISCLTERVTTGSRWVTSAADD